MRRRSPKSPRRRAKQERALQTIAVIFEAAARVLQSEGYAGATTNRIAEVAGVSVGTIYQYFANKEHLFDALIRSEIEALLEVLQAQSAARGAQSGRARSRQPARADGALLGVPAGGRTRELSPRRAPCGRAESEHARRAERLGFAQSYVEGSSAGIDTLQRAIRLAQRDPLAWGIWDNLSGAYFLAGRSAEGLDAAERVIEMRPDYSWGYLDLAMNQVGLGRLDEARATMRTARRQDPGLTLEAVRRTGLSPEIVERLSAPLREAGLE